MVKKGGSIAKGDQISAVVVEIYAATRNEELNEGRGQTIDNSYHTSRRSALVACRGIDVMGSDGQVSERLALKSDDGRYFLLKNNNKPIVVRSDEEEVKAEADLRKEALKKLSQAERAALGI